jgi:4,5-dihydroxyphthalate decarboxylase
VASARRLTLAVSDYDHVRDLVTGAAAVPGIELAVEMLEVGEIFQRAMRSQPWDVHEMSLGMYVARLAAGDRSLAAIPVFPSRMFRLSAWFVRADGPVQQPADLRGRRVGDPDWAMTAGIYARGWLQHEIGVAPAEIEWVQAGLNAPGRTETLAFHFPPGLRRSSRPDSSLDAMLAAGEIDAVLSAQPPRGFFTPGGGVRRLVGEAAVQERDYARRSGIFPIMHVIAMRRELAGEPGLAAALMAGFEAAKCRSLARLRDSMASRFPYPWTWTLATEAEALFGADPWPYGVARNRPTLEAFLDFCAEQGVGARRVALQELFVPGAEEPAALGG